MTDRETNRRQEERDKVKEKMGTTTFEKLGLKPYDRKLGKSICPKCGGSIVFEACSKDGEVVKCPYCTHSVFFENSTRLDRHKLIVHPEELKKELEID